MSRRAKRVGTIEPSFSSYLQKTVEDVISGGKRMSLTIFYHERQADIFIGNQQIYCAYAQVYYKTNGEIIETADLHKIRWDSECSYDEPFQHGKDTTMIFNLIITIIKDKFPDVKHVRFNDASSRQCDDNMGTMNLGMMKLFTDGETWYESHFKAYIDPSCEKLYHMKIKQANESKNQMTWEQAKQYMNYSHPKITESEFKEKYESTETWREWLKWVRNKLKDSDFCKWLTNHGWFDVFIRSVLRFDILNYHFLVNTHSFHQPYTIKKSGGRREGTRKKRRAM